VILWRGAEREGGGARRRLNRELGGGDKEIQQEGERGKRKTSTPGIKLT
jgi:hypothetical protein